MKYAASHEYEVSTFPALLTPTGSERDRGLSFPGIMMGVRVV